MYPGKVKMRQLALKNRPVLVKVKRDSVSATMNWEIIKAEQGGRTEKSYDFRQLRVI